MQKPSIGRIVIVQGVQSNGSKDHPAIVNAVFDGAGYGDGRDYSVNVTMFPDCAVVKQYTSLAMFEDRAKAEEWRSKQTCAPCLAAFWPDRVPA